MESNRLENQHALLEAGADPDSVDDGDAWQSLEDRAEARLKAAQAGQKVTFKADCSGWNNYHFFLAATPRDVARCIDDTDRLSKDVGTSTPLHAAAKAGRPEHVAALVNAGERIDARDRFGRTPLHAAVSNAGVLMFSQNLAVNYENLKLPDASRMSASIVVLLDAGAQIHARDEKGRTPLHAAAEEGLPEYIGMLVDAGADVSARDDSGRTPLHVVFRDHFSSKSSHIYWMGLFLAAEVTEGDTARQTANIAALLDAGAQVQARNNKGRTPLHAAALWGTPEHIAAMVGGGADIYFGDESGDTPLHLAAGSGTAENIAALLSAGADLDARNKLGNTPLSSAARSKPENIPILLQAGASLDASNPVGNTPLYAAASSGTPEGIAALVKAGADVNSINDLKRTPMHDAAGNGPPENISALLVEGADPGVRDKFGKTPLHEAAAFGSPENISMLIEAGAPVDASDRQGRQPLHLAARYGSAEAITALLDAGANPTIEDREGNSAWDPAKGRKELQGTEAYGRLKPVGNPTSAKH